MVTYDGKIINYNHKFMRMWHIPKAIMSTKDEAKIFAFVKDQLEEPDKFLQTIQEYHHHPETANIDILRFKDGRVFERYSHPHFSDDNHQGLIWIFHDVTQHAKLGENLQRQLTHDDLTKLPNRILLYDRMQQVMNVSKRDHTCFAILVFDLDRFKIINDSLTHAVGDELLCAIARRFQALMREGDTLARLGGDEFVVIAANILKEEQAMDIARELLDIVNTPFKIAGREIALTASVGVSIYPKDGATAELILRNADTAVYRAKERATNAIEFYTADMNIQSLARLDQEEQLRYALAHNHFILHYQPQFNLTTGELVGVEALLRWQHPVKGLILPNEFIPLAEDMGLIVPIDQVGFFSNNLN